MKSLSTLLAATCLVLIAVSTVTADALPKIFVSVSGSDSNPGTSVLPKRTFQAAHDAVAAGGEIVVLDTGGYGAINITKSVSIVTPTGINGFSTVSGTTTAIVIQAGATDIVSIRGLILEGGGTSGGYGILTTSVGTLRVEDCVIRNFSIGIYFFATNTSHLVVNGGSGRDNAIGIEIEAAEASITADAVVTGCLLDGMTGTALLATTDDPTAKAQLVARDCVVNHCNLALYPFTAQSTVYADNCLVSNGNNGVVGTVGTSISRANNTFIGVGSPGSFSSTLSPK